MFLRLKVQSLTIIRYPEPGTDVENKDMERLLSWYWTHYRCRNKFCHPKHGERGMFIRHLFSILLTV